MNAVDQLEALRSPAAANDTTDPALLKVRDAWERFQGASPSGDRFTFENAADLLARVLPPLLWLICAFIPEASVLVIAGEPKTSKTWLALTFAICVSARAYLFGLFKVPLTARPGVAYFALEDSERSFKTRLTAIARGMGLDPVEAVRNVYVRCRSSLNLLSDVDLFGLAAACEGLELAALVIDPIRDAHNGEENSADSMAELMRRLRFLREFLGCAVIFVHHSAKAGPDKANRRPGQMMRGSSVVHGSVDGGIYLSMTKATENQWVNTVLVELKAGKGAGTFGLTLDVEDDENGEAQVARWTFSAEPSAKARDALQDNTTKLLDILRLTFEQNPPGKQGLNRDAIRVALGCGAKEAQSAISEVMRQGLGRYSKKEGGTVYVPREGASDAL
jgi:hypothetical protein